MTTARNKARVAAFRTAFGRAPDNAELLALGVLDSLDMVKEDADHGRQIRKVGTLNFLLEDEDTDEFPRDDPTYRGPGTEE